MEDLVVVLFLEFRLKIVFNFSFPYPFDETHLETRANVFIHILYDNYLPLFPTNCAKCKPTDCKFFRLMSRWHSMFTLGCPLSFLFFSASQQLKLARNVVEYTVLCGNTRQKHTASNCQQLLFFKHFVGRQISHDDSNFRLLLSSSN